MKLLLDSHAFLWAIMAPEKLSRKSRAALTSAENESFVSAITFWELSLKYSLGKLTLEGITPEELPQTAEEAGFIVISLESQTAAGFHQLPRITHKVPFDRMLIWQAIQMGYTLVTKDTALKEYEKQGLKILW